MKKKVLAIMAAIITVFGEQSVDVLKKHEDLVHQKVKEADKSALEWAWAVLFRQQHVGAKRLKEKIPDTVPAGEVLLMEKGLIVGTFPDENIKLSNLKIVDEKRRRVVYRKKMINTFVLIPSKLFEYNNQYAISCNIIYPDHIISFNDKFKILSKKDHRDFYSKMKRIISDVKDESIKDFIEAVYFFDAGYDYNGNAKILETLSQR